ADARFTSDEHTGPRASARCIQRAVELRELCRTADQRRLRTIERRRPESGLKIRRGARLRSVAPVAVRASLGAILQNGLVQLARLRVGVGPALGRGPLG